MSIYKPFEDPVKERKAQVLAKDILTKTGKDDDKSKRRALAVSRKLLSK